MKRALVMIGIALLMAVLAAACGSGSNSVDIGTKPEQQVDTAAVSEKKDSGNTDEMNTAKEETHANKEELEKETKEVEVLTLIPAKRPSALDLNPHPSISEEQLSGKNGLTMIGPLYHEKYRIQPVDYYIEGAFYHRSI
jgi:hypothetical protein